jgi:DNA repair protein RecN (Recombination protein N)
VLRRLRIENLVLIREAELELAPGLNAITGETGAGKTILAQAVGLLLGQKGDDSFVGPAGSEAYVEAELDLPAELDELDELRPEDEDALLEARLAELQALVEDTEGMEPDDEERLRADRERLRHVADLAEAAAAAAAALTPEEGEGAAGLVAVAERAVAPLERLAPELQRAGDELRDVELRLRETATELYSFLASLEAEPRRLDELEAGLDRIAEAKRRFRCQTYEELLARAVEARVELEALAGGADPAAAAADAVRAAEARVAAIGDDLRAERHAAAPAFADAVAAELHDVGMGDGEFVCELRERETGVTGADEAAFLVRPNPGLPFAPVAETASGGELSRIALAIAAVAGGETLVFDEIDAGIGGETANAVGRVLRRLAERAQVITITHLPQIAALADRHFVVEKVPGDPTHTRIEPLADEERKAELERMLGGEEFLATVRG